MLTCIKFKGKYRNYHNGNCQWTYLGCKMCVNNFIFSHSAPNGWHRKFLQQASPVLALYQGGDIHRTKQTHKVLWYFFFIVIFPGLERWHIVRRNLRQHGLDSRRARERESVSRYKLPILRSQPIMLNIADCQRGPWRPNWRRDLQNSGHWRYSQESPKSVQCDEISACGGNGVLDVEEFQSLMRQMSPALEAAFASIDSNQDGKISFEEMKKVRLIRNQWWVWYILITKFYWNFPPVWSGDQWGMHKEGIRSGGRMVRGDL